MKLFLASILFLLSISLHAGTTVYSAPDETGLVGYWKMDTTNGIDYSGFGNTGTNISGCTNAMGVVGLSLGFNGTSQYVSLPIGVGSTSGTISISFWFYPMSTNNAVLVARASQTSGYPQNWVVNFQNNGIGFGSSADSFLYCYSGAIDTNTWVFAVCEYDSLTKIRSIYTNGVFATSVTNSTAPPTSINSSLPTIGAISTDAPSSYFRGYLDEIRIFYSNLSITKITNLYNFRQTTYLTNGTTPYKP